MNSFQDLTNYELYCTSLYFTITTLVTVGYGDITAKNAYERLICSVLMIVGVVSFSYMTGALASLIQSIDQNDA